jgi:hypothetical protein
MAHSVDAIIRPTRCLVPNARCVVSGRPLVASRRYIGAARRPTPPLLPLDISRLLEVVGLLLAIANLPFQLALSLTFLALLLRRA